MDFFFVYKGIRKPTIEKKKKLKIIILPCSKPQEWT